MKHIVDLPALQIADAIRKFGATTFPPDRLADAQLYLNIFTLRALEILGAIGGVSDERRQRQR